MIRTVCPRVLLFRQMVEKESARGLEDEVAGDGGDAFELWGDRIEETGVKRGAFRNVARVGRKDGVNLAV